MIYASPYCLRVDGLCPEFRCCWRRNSFTHFHLRCFSKGQVWEGVYTCQTEAGARLWIHSSTPQQINATLEFFPLTTGQLWPYGRAKTVSTWEKDVLQLRETTWQVQPPDFGRPRLMKVELRENGNVALLSFTREDFEK